MWELLVGIVLSSAPVSAAMPPEADTLRISLEDAVRRAMIVAPRVQIAEGRILAAQGERAEAVWPFPTNPTVEYERARRESVGRQTHDRGWRLSQRIELAGQSFLRSGAAGRRVQAAEALVSDAERLAALDARLTYLTLYLSERLSALTDSNAVFAERLAAWGSRQLEAGEINLLEYNVTALEATRARSEATRAEADRRAAAADLAMILALPHDSTPSTADLEALPDLDLTVTRLLGVASERRPDVQAVALEVEAAGRAVTATRLGGLPDLQLALFSAQEEGTDDLFGFSVGLSVPLFQRDQGSVGRARADRETARAQSTSTNRRVVAEVLAASALYLGALEAQSRFETGLLQVASENVVLAEMAFDGGELSIAEVVLFRSAALGAQLEYLEVLADEYQAWFELAAALAARPDELSELLRGTP